MDSTSFYLKCKQTHTAGYTAKRKGPPRKSSKQFLHFLTHRKKNRYNFRIEVSMCPARRTVNVKSICPASVNHVSYRVRSRGFSLAGRPLQAAQIATQTFLDSRHNPTALA